MGSSLFDLGSAIPPIGPEPAVLSPAIEEARAPELGRDAVALSTLSADAPVETEAAPASAVGGPASTGPDLVADALQAYDDSPSGELLALNDETVLAAALPRAKPIRLAALEEPPAAEPEAQPAPEVAAPAPALWATVHYFSDEGAEKANEIARRLRANGVGTVETVRVSIKVSFNQLRYFHEESADAAKTLVEALAEPGSDVALPSFSAADFTKFRPQPRAGLIEVWVGEP